MNNLQENSPETSTIIADGLFRHFLGKYRWPMFLGILALALTDLMDVLPPLIIKFAIDAIEAGRGMAFLWTSCAVFMAAAVAQAVFRFFWRKYFLGTSHTIAYDLRKRMFEHLQKLSFRYFTHSKTGELMSRLTNDVDEVRLMFGIGLLLAMDSLFYFATVPFILLWMSPKLALYILIPLPVIPIFVMKMRGVIHARSKRVQERLAELSAKAQENISGIRVVKTFVREQSEIAAFNLVSQKYVDENLSLGKIESGFHPALGFSMGVGVCVLIWFGGRLVIDGGISLGSFVAFQAYLLKLIWPMTALGLTINIYQRGMASLGRCGEILSETLAQGYDEAPVNDSATGSDASAKLPPNAGEIEIRSLSFSYPGSGEQVLKNVSIKIKAGETVAFVGPVGSGKSSLINLLLRLYDPPEGTIFLDGLDLTTQPTKLLRGIIGYVPQDAFLFSESVLENITMGLKEKADLARVNDFIKLAQMVDDVSSLPDKLETILGERGVNLSGGQKQRLTIARALIRDPRILILDDCMSAVDTDTEDRILSGLKLFMKGRTTIMVSNRLASIQHADRIYFLASGAVAESGTHEELVALGGRYAHLWEQQKLKAELDRNFVPAGNEGPGKK